MPSYLEMISETSDGFMLLKLSRALFLGGVSGMGTLDESSVDLEENIRSAVDVRTLN